MSAREFIHLNWIVCMCTVYNIIIIIIRFILECFVIVDFRVRNANEFEELNRNIHHKEPNRDRRRRAQ